MEKTMKKLSENILDKLSMDFLRNQVLKNAYGNDDTVIAKLDPRVLLVWYLFFGLVPWFSGNVVFLAGCFMLTGIVFIYFGRIFTDRIFADRILIFWWKCNDDSAAVDSDLEGGNGFFGIDHSLFRSGPGSSVKWTDVVWMSGTIIIFHLLCISYASDVDGRISKCAVILPSERKSTGKQRICRQGEESYLSGQDHYAVILSADVKYGETIPHDRRSFGNARISICGNE